MGCPATCPEPNRLKELLDSRLSEPEQSQLVTHLDSCECCQQSLEELARSGLSWPGPAAAAAEDDRPPSGSAFWPALERIEQDVATRVLAPAPRTPVAVPADGLKLEFLSPSERADSLGKLGTFEITEVIGRGGMGVVLRAFDPCLQRFVAVKVLDPTLANNEMARKRFCREARAAAAITHENVVAIHQVEREEAKDLPFLVMQLVTGVSLQERLDRGEPLELREILRIGMQTAAGLAAAHAQGLVHRDIKPANILLENGLERVRLTDFGLARAAEDVKLTQTGFVAGTPLFMAPEQARGEPVDARTDLFSLGSVLYAMCTGRPPFEGSTPFVVLKHVTDAEPRPIQELNPKIPDWLAAFIEKLHAKSPADRFQSAAEVAEILAQHLTFLEQASKSDTQKCPPCSGATPRAVRRAARSRLLVAVGTLVLATGAVFGAARGFPRFNQFLASVLGIRPAEQVAPSEPPRETLVAQAGPIWSVTFSPDGDTLAMGIDDGVVKFWDLKAVQVRATLNAHRGPVWSVAFSPDGRTLATASDDGGSRLWDVTTLSERQVFKHTAAVRSIGFSPDGRSVVTGGRDGGVRVWDVASGQESIATKGHQGNVVAVAYAPDGRTIASASGDKTVKLWDAATGQERLTLQGHAGGIYAVAFSPDSKRLASGGWDKTVRLWEAGSGNQLAALQGHTKAVWAVAFVPDGRTLVSAGEDEVVKLWDVATGRERAAFRGHTGALHAVAVSRDGRTVASAGRDGTAKLWDVK